MHPRRDDSKNIEGAQRPNYNRRGARAGAPVRGRGGYASSHQYTNFRGGHDTTNDMPYPAPSNTIQRWHQNAPWAVGLNRQPSAYPPLAFGSVPPQNYATNVPPSFGFVPGGLTSNPTAYQRQYQPVVPAEDVEMDYAAQEMEHRPARDLPRRDEGDHRRDEPPQTKGKWKGKGKQRDYTPEPGESETRSANWKEEWRAPPVRQETWRSNEAGPSTSSSSSSRGGRQSRPTRGFQIIIRDDDMNDPDYEAKLLEEYRAMKQARQEEEEHRRRVMELEATIREASRELKELKSKKHGRSPSEEQDQKRARTDERSMDERSSASRTTASSRPWTRASSPVAGPSRPRQKPESPKPGPSRPWQRPESPKAGPSRPRYEKQLESKESRSERPFSIDYSRRPTADDIVLLEKTLAPPREMVPRSQNEVIQEVFDFPETKYPRPDRREMIARTAPEGRAPSMEEIRRRNAAGSEAEARLTMDEALEQSDYGEEEFDWRYEEIADTDSPEERASKKKHNNKVDSMVREQYDKEKSLYYKQQGRSPLPQVKIDGQTVHNNELGGIIIPRTFYHRPSNTVLVGRRAEDAIEAEETGEKYTPPKRKNFPFAYGIPMTPREVREGVRIVLYQERHPHILEIRYLLCWFYRVATFLIPELRDWAMWDTLALFAEHSELSGINIDELDPPPYLQMPRIAGMDPREPIAQPEHTAVLEEHLSYAIMYQAPGTVNHPRGLVFAYNNYVYVPSVLAWMILRLTGPNGSANTNAMREYTRHLVTITITPGRFTDLINQWNEREPQNPLTLPTWSPALYHFRVRRGHNNIDEIAVIRHLLHCGITQRIVDTMYAWGMQQAYCNAHSATNAFHAEHLRQIEPERRRRLSERGVPQPMTEYDGWWSIPRSGELRLRHVVDDELWGEEHQRRTLPDGGNRFTRGRWFRIGASPFRTEIFTPAAGAVHGAVEDVEMGVDQGGIATHIEEVVEEGRREVPQSTEMVQAPMEVDTSTVVEEGELARTTETATTAHNATSEGPNRPDDGMEETEKPDDPNRSEAKTPAEVAPANVPLPPSDDEEF